MNGLGARTLRGLRWDYARTAVIVFAQVAYTVVMARLLEPEVFGLFALGLLVLGAGRYLAQTGLAAAVIQKRELDRDEIRASFTASLALGLLLAAVIAAIAPLAARFFEAPGLTPVVRVLALNVLILGIANTAEALLQRTLAFRALAVSEALGYLIGAFGVGVVLAARGHGVWSLVVGLLAQSSIHAALCYRNARHTLRPTLRWGPYRALLPFGSWASLAGIVEYTFQNLDTLVIGRLLSASQLGLYNRASLLIRVPVHHLAFGLVRVLFPSFSRLQDDAKAFGAGYYRAVAVTAALLLPLGAAVSVAAEPLVEVALGGRWLDAAPVLAVVALVAPLHMLTELTISAWAARGWLQLRLVLQAAFLALMLFAYLAAARHGLLGIALALLAVELVRHAAFAALTATMLQPTRADLRDAYAAPVVTAAGTALTVALVDGALQALGATPLWRLLGDAASGGVVVLVSLWAGPLRPLRPLLKAALRRSRDAAGRARP